MRNIFRVVLYQVHFYDAKIGKILHVCKKIHTFSMFFNIILCRIQKKVVILSSISQNLSCCTAVHAPCDGELSNLISLTT